MPARKIGNRHQFDRGDAELRQSVQMPGNSRKSSQQPGMKFIKHRVFPRAPLPSVALPSVRRGISDDAWIVHVIILHAGRWIWNGRVANAEMVPRAGATIGGSFVPAV